MNKYLTTLMLLILCLTFSKSAFSSEQTGIIKVTVRGFQSSEGTIMIGLYNKALLFPKTGKHLKGQAVKAIGKEVQVIFLGLPLGEYAIAAYHDKNSDMVLEKNFMGVPQEAYGFSNNVRGTLGPPSFKEAKLNLKNGSSLDVIINIK
ncbi:MAG: DUF2141 domain-containing protein [Desulfobacterales bacterium]|nr:DUF2141 domain-containing protein [Desulfobacterales bacterium]MCP4162144.1 DUF2141 domain-containing protein [Deltaproteobacteria bacterium]